MTFYKHFTLTLQRKGGRKHGICNPHSKAEGFVKYVTTYGMRAAYTLLKATRGSRSQPSLAQQLEPVTSDFIHLLCYGLSQFATKQSGEQYSQE
jgi:hypothetical protein